MRDLFSILIRSCFAKKHSILPYFLFLLLMSCGPSIYYLGDTYPTTEQVDVFYDEKDIPRAYTTIGQMTHDKIVNYAPELIREEMIQDAKKRGADGIIFTDVVMERENEMDGDRLSVKAKLIRYKP